MMLGVAAVVAGADVQVSTHTTNDQFSPSIAADGAGNFVVVWTSQSQDGDSLGVFGQRLDNSAAPLGAEFQVNTYTTFGQGDARVAADASGNFVVVWVDDTQDGSFTGIVGQGFNSAGAAVGGEFQVNTYTTYFQFAPAIAADAAGNFTVVWNDRGDIVGRRFDGGGTPLSGEFAVNTYTTDFQSGPAIAAEPAGSFVVTWHSPGQDDGEGSYGGGVFAQRFSSTGTPLGVEFQVNSYMTGRQYLSAVAADAAGNFTVVWHSSGQDDGVPALSFGGGVYGQRFTAAGVAVGAEFQVNSHTTGAQNYPAIALDAAGNGLVVWQDLDAPFGTAVGQRYDSAGTPVGGEFKLAATLSGRAEPAAAFDAAGNFLTVWDDLDGSGLGVFGHRNKPDRLLRGKTLNVRDLVGNESRRGVSMLARETATEIGRSIDGDPTGVGGTLRVITNGATSSDQTYLLDASGWSTIGTSGYRYAGPTGGDGDPVRRVVLKRKPGGNAMLKIVLDGAVGTQSLDVVPPDEGTDGGAILQIGNGGGTYCTSFGGAAGGVEQADDVQRWQIANPTAEPGCPSP